MKKSKILIATLCTFCFGLGAFAIGANVQGPKAVEAAVPSGAQTVSFDSADWAHYGSGTGSDYWQVNSDNFKFLGNGGFTDHVFLTEQFDTTLANYTFSADFVGTYSTTPIDKEMHAGIVPWYVDSNNWIIVYAQWWNPGVEARLATEMREVSIFCKINGTEFVYFMSYEDGWGWHNSTCWHDKWTNGNNLLPVNGFHLSVTKSRLMEAGVASDWIDLSVSSLDQTTWSTSTYHGEWKFRDTADTNNRYEKPLVGFYCQNDVFTVSNVAFNYDAYTVDNAAGFISTNAYNFLDTISDSSLCATIDANPETAKSDLESAYAGLTSDDKARLANVTYGGGKHNVLSAYEYYVAYAQSLINNHNALAIIGYSEDTSVFYPVLIITAISAITLCGFVVLKRKTRNK